MTEEERDDRRRKRAALLLLPLFLLGAACCVWSLSANVALGEAESFIPAPLGSGALANYGQDEISGRLRSLSISIVGAVIRDRDPETDDADNRATEVAESLQTPVPTVPGAATGTPTPTPIPTLTPVLTVTGTVTSTASPLPLPTRTSTATDAPTAAPTSGPSSTPSKTPPPSKTPIPSATPLCKVPPHIEIIAPLADQRFTLAEDLPAQAFAYDPDNVNPLTCSITPAIFPDDDGEGISGDPEVEMRIEWWNGSSWVLVHTELESSRAYCPFGDDDPFCLTHDLTSGEWPDSTPINNGKHRLKAKVLQDDEGVPSGWVSVEFYIDPVPTSTPTSTNTPTSTPTPTPTPSNTPTPTDTPTLTSTPSDTPTPTFTPTPDTCALTTLTGFTAFEPNIWWSITNGNLVDVIEIIQFDLSWSFPETLDKAEMDGSDFWNGNLTSPASVSSGWTGSIDKRRVDPGVTRQLRFNFNQDPVPATGYALDLTLLNLTTSDTCVLSVTVP